MRTYVLKAGNTPLMPCHPARARELVRKGRAHWFRRDTIRLNEYREDCTVQEVTVGIDSGAGHIGIVAIAKRAKHKPRVIFRALIHPRPIKEIQGLLNKRRSLRRGRRRRQWYRQPFFSPTRRVRLSAKLFDKEGNFLYKIPVAVGRKLTRPNEKGQPLAKRIGGNRFRLLTNNQPPTPLRVKKPNKGDVLVYTKEGRLITWYDSKRGDLQDIKKRLLGLSRRHKHPIATIQKRDECEAIVLLSKAAEKHIPKDALPNAMPPFRKFGQKRKPKGWLSPSVRSLAEAHVHSVDLLKKYVPVGNVRMETAAFDIQKLNNPKISDAGYRRPPLYAKQNRKDFILARDNWKCVYCGASGLGSNKTILTQDHVVPKNPKVGIGGPNTIDNLVAACHSCQREKNNLFLEQFLATKPAAEVRRIKEHISKLKNTNQPFYNATYVGQIKTYLLATLKATDTWGYVTKQNRIAMRLTKSHDTDAIAIASMGKQVDTHLPRLRVYYTRRYPPGKASRRQQHKTNPVGKRRLNERALAPQWVGQGKHGRWVTRTIVNKYLEIANGERIRLRDLVETVDGRLGYVMKIRSDKRVSLSLRPVGQKGQFSCSTSKIKRIIRKRTGLLEDLSIN